MSLSFTRLIHHDAHPAQQTGHAVVFEKRRFIAHAHGMLSLTSNEWIARRTGHEQRAAGHNCTNRNTELRDHTEDQMH